MILKSAECEHVEDTRTRVIVQEIIDIVTKRSVSYLLYYICKISTLSSVFKRLYKYTIKSKQTRILKKLKN